MCIYEKEGGGKLIRALFPRGGGGGGGVTSEILSRREEGAK